MDRLRVRRLVAVALVATAVPAFAEESSRHSLLTQAGLSETEQALVEGAIRHWAARVEEGDGSAGALACLGQAAGVYDPCLATARADGDALGEGLLHLLSAFASVASGDPGGALGPLQSADQRLGASLPEDYPLWAVVHSALGVVLAASGRHGEAIGHYQRALEIERGSLGPEHHDVAVNLLNLGSSWVPLREWDRAEAAFRAAAEIFARETGNEMLQATCQGRLGALLLERGDPEGARPYFERALALMEEALGPEQPAVAVATGNLAESYRRQGAYSAARPLFERALSIIEASLGPGHPQAAVYEERLGLVLAELGELDSARLLLERALTVREGVYGAEHPFVAATLEHLASVHQQLMDYPGATALLERALEINEQTAGPDSLPVASTHERLGELQRERGNYVAAQSHHEEALDLRRAIQGPTHPDVATGVLNQANLLRDMGEPAAAKLQYERALEIYRNALGEDHPHLATALTNLAALQEETGDLAAAIPSTERAIEIYTGTVGETHPWVAVALNNLALMYRATDQFEEAVPLLERAVAIWEASLGREHPQTAIGLNNLALLLAQCDHPAEAQKALERAAAISEKTLGPEHPQFAKTLSNLGGLQRMAGDLPAARANLERSLRILEKGVGPDHPAAVPVLMEMVDLHLAAGETEAARQRLERAFSLLEDVTGPLLDATSERERIALIRSRRMFLDRLISLFDRPDDATRSYRAVLRWKGVVKSSLAAQRATALAAQEPELQATFETLAAVRRQLAETVFSRPDPARREDRQRAVAALTETKEALERELASASARFRRESSLEVVSVEQVCRELAPDEALVDYLRFERAIPEERENQLTWTPEYTAFLLLGGACGSPLRVALGPAEEIDRGIDRYRGLLQRTAPERLLNRQAQRLRELVFDPVAARLDGRHRIWLVPDAALNGLPFAALVDQDGRYLIEQVTFSLLSSGNDLRRVADDVPGGVAGALLVGAIDYDTSVLEVGEADAPIASSTRAPPEGVLDRFTPLPATGQEVEEIAKTLSEVTSDREIERLTGNAATETRLRSAVSRKRIVHLATHGFFATGKVRSALAAIPEEHARLVAEGEPPAGYNPMLLAGVVLAGANARGSADDDGLLTAEEVAGLDLRGVELVTLSACDTALGDIRDGEGVMGLRRAFSLAGAEAMVMSLWRVADEETRRLMAAFYARLSEGTDKAEALRKAQQGLIAQLHAERGESHPFFWAAFVISGQ
jgi:CHAT domain-containing protein/Tfp pilus assembly protein PilF